MAILGQIRSKPWLLMGVIALALLAFLVNPDSIEKVFGKNPDVLGKVNGECNGVKEEIELSLKTETEKEIN